MSVNLTFTADNTKVVKKLGEIHEKMKSISWAEMTMGVDAVLNLLGKVKAGVVAVFDAVVAPAAEMEQLAAQFNTMLGFGFSAERSMAVLRRLGDMAAVSYPCMIVAAFRNRQRHLDWIKQGRAMVAIKNGNRWALIPEDCSARVEVLARRHLTGRKNSICAILTITN